MGPSAGSPPLLLKLVVCKKLLEAGVLAELIKVASVATLRQRSWGERRLLVVVFLAMGPLEAWDLLREPSWLHGLVLDLTLGGTVLVAGELRHCARAPLAERASHHIKPSAGIALLPAQMARDLPPTSARPLSEDQRQATPFQAEHQGGRAWFKRPSSRATRHPVRRASRGERR